MCLQKYTNTDFSSLSFLMFKKFANWFKSKVVKEWSYSFRLRGLCAKFHFWLHIFDQVQGPWKETHRKENIPLTSGERHSSRLRGEEKGLCLELGVLLEFGFHREDACSPSPWGWSSCSDEVMAVPVSLGHALSAHSSSSSLKRCCCKQVIPEEWLQRTNKSYMCNPETPGSAFGSLDIMRSWKQHSRPERSRLLDEKKGEAGRE